MLRSRSLVVWGVAVVLLAGCGSDGSTGSPGAAAGDGDVGGHGDAHIVMSGWRGCDVFDDLVPLQDFLGAVGTGEYGLSDSDPSAMERPSCQATLDLATFVNDLGTSTVETTGEAVVSLSLTTMLSEDEAAADYRSAWDQMNSSDIERTDVQEGSLDGDWDESYVFSGNREMRFDIFVLARYEHWYLKFSLDVRHDPGRAAFERHPDLYPGGSADAMAVYPFTSPELLEWVTDEYFPQIYSNIVDRVDVEVCDMTPNRC